MNTRRSKQQFSRHLNRGEDTVVLVVFFAITFLPAIETVLRALGVPGVPASAILVQHLTLWIGFAGAILATRQNKLLSLTTKPLFTAEDEFHPGRWLAKTVSFMVALALMWGSWQLVRVEMQYPREIAPGLPIWFAQIIMPIGFGLIALQIYFHSFRDRLLRATMLMVPVLLIGLNMTGYFQDSIWVIALSLGVLLTALLFGAPIFIGLGGAAVILFWNSYVPLSAIPAETYRIVVSPTLPTIPLFTLAGYILAEGGASKRMLKLFRTWFGWIPGGTPVVVVILCGFFTALTGGSGVTILALGGILVPLLIKEGYSRIFAIGLVTVAGSLGLLFPPSLPAIIYGVTAGVSVKSMFVAGVVPGIVLVVAVSAWAIRRGKIDHIKHRPFKVRDAVAALRETKWEAVIPVGILFGIFGGFTTLVETAALTAVYVLIVEVFIYKDLSLQKIPKIVVDCATLIGGVLIILGVAMGLTSYLVDAQIPMLLLDMVKTLVASKYVFLIMLNIFLLLVGCLMDIFSAIIVVVPLIAPLGIYFGIDPVHLGIIFIANLELGFLTPPVGMNLFLSAYRFDESMPVIYKATLPFFLIRFVIVLAITYLPFLSLGLLG
ncbi:MAG: TRAP transporter large permease subunit [Candidatus Neomarinimicrobiota bacterium]